MQNHEEVRFLTLRTTCTCYMCASWTDKHLGSFSQDPHCMDGLTSQLGSPPQCGGTGQVLVESQLQYLCWDLQAHNDKKDNC